MKIAAAVIGAILFAATTTSVVLAGPNTATTELLDAPTAGASMNVRFTVLGTTPVVPYEYALENVCITGKGGGYRVGQHDSIVYWTDHDSDGNPQVTMAVNLQSVPAGAACKISLVRNNVAVKGSTVSYTVGP